MKSLKKDTVDLMKNHPNWEKNRNELYNIALRIDAGTAMDFWWWMDGNTVKHRNKSAYEALTVAKEDLLLLLDTDDLITRAIIEWRIKRNY